MSSEPWGFLAASWGAWVVGDYMWFNIHHHHHHPLGLFGVWKIIGEVLRLIVDGRPANAYFRTPRFVHTAGDSFAQM